jgi:hypothetical protein
MPADVLAAPERNRYFYGLLMDAERFQKDQDYFNAKRWLLNRFVTGGGVICGLGLTYNAATNSLTLSPGVAIDFTGREIVVPTATPVDIATLTDAHGKPVGATPPDATIVVSVVYSERKIDAVPVLVPDCENPGNCSPSTIEEGFSVLVRVATGPPPAIPGCAFGSFPLTPSALQTAIATQVAGDFTSAPADPSVALGRLNLSTSTLDAVSDRPIVYDNALLYQLITCLAAQVGAVNLTYVSGDNQSAGAFAALPNPLVVSLVDGSGNPVTGGSAPTFTVTPGSGSTGPVMAAANPGQYQTTWTLGKAGAQTVLAKTTQSSLTVTFNATIQP